MTSLKFWFNIELAHAPKCFEFRITFIVKQPNEINETV